MGSLRFDGVRFTVYTMDHAPRHVHGFYAELEVIVDLRLDGAVSLARRKYAVRSGNGSVADIRHVLTVAAKHFEKLAALWEKHHG
ncbi:MAG: DUF4160 domain-containing protein [Terracidiphilus sp.]|jgi:hypothetical protein